ncbi:polyhydroxyalkanoic acid synthase [Halieaceae bacterium IMCC14734]|uniref:Polyhydroxyalkanoic acid synthase n=1 Tax=Candidatus Litorirhabdus singularis TaxID=2518993 RepID=A0ABT3TKG4_9GAMM|nr:polyhydroxyalkanoic acid system family protein [Candidatus Litorirhabdus singularis]MCX2982793.1 polyhydroxyalkanoic acid synthase [Candidatus Litorirhabdus singularis]
MASFSISKPHTMTREDVRDAAENLAKGLKDRHGLRYRWRGDTAEFSRSGLDGRLIISDDNITVSVKLGLLASAFERPLKKAVTDYLDEYVS